jgi:nicotinamide phosphoribosyltransferase
MDMAMDYYGASIDGLAYSVPATEHSIMTSLGKEGELMLMANLFRDYPEGILSVVIDSYNYRDFIELMGTAFKEIIVNRKGKTVFRPDSGDPVSVSLEVIEGLAKNFGYTTNSKGYKELPAYIGVLWGDGIDYDGIRNILFALKNKGWASSNIIFGMGGALLQKVNRDIQRFAFKSSAQERDGVWYDIFKEPLDSSKVSKRGKLKLSKNSEGHFFTVKDNSDDYTDLLETVFENGEIKKEYTFDEVRKNAAE